MDLECEVVVRGRSSWAILLAKERNSLLRLGPTFRGPACPDVRNQSGDNETRMSSHPYLHTCDALTCNHLKDHTSPHHSSISYPCEVPLLLEAGLVLTPRH